MLYKNFEIHGCAQILDGKNGGIVIRRVPENVYNALETDDARRMCRISTGVELRFVIESGDAVLKIKNMEGIGRFQVFRGSIQGAWFDSGYITEEITEITIKKSENSETLKRIADEFHQPFSPEVVRVIIHTGEFEIFGIDGDIRPPKTEEMPKRTLLAYGSSITHDLGGGAEQGWLAQVGYNLGVDTRNLGIAGHCRMEKEMIDYIADEGKKGNWDMAIISMGVNVLYWEREKIIPRVTYSIEKIAKDNPDKPIFAVSLIYTSEDYKGVRQPLIWREEIEAAVNRLKFPNVAYINGLDLARNMSFISADEIHPGVYGIQEIAKNMTKIISEKMEEK